ncbi:MAG: glycosyltransferase family 2 protein [Sphingobacteriia bacterium]|nr:glycosyltransferase family 2 protein [Sphingobacteriia bacterium]
MMPELEQNKPDVSIVIVNYNVQNLILKCLQSIEDYCQLSDIEIIVVDNNSSDESVAMVKHHFPYVVLIENTKNEGFPKANNQAFAKARGQYIFMLNPDAELCDDAVSMLRNYMETNPFVALAAPKLLNTDGSFQQSFWRFPRMRYIIAEDFYCKPLLKKKHYNDKNVNEILMVDSVSGAAMFFRKSILNLVGELDETLFWLEDVDFCYRIAQQNMKIAYVPSVQVVHHIGQSAKKNYEISISNQVYNKIKFIGKHYSKWQSVWIKLHSFFIVGLKIIVFGMLAPFNKIYRLKAKAYVYTIKRVFNPPIGIR